MGQIVVTEFITLDGVAEDPEELRASPAVAGHSSSTAVTKATGSNTRSCWQATRTYRTAHLPGVR